MYPEKTTDLSHNVVSSKIRHKRRSNSHLPYHHDHDGPLQNNQENVPIRALKQHGDTFIRTLTIIREHWHIIEKNIITLNFEY